MLTLKDIPDVEFVNVNIEDLLAENIKTFEDAWYQQYNETKTLAPGDPIRVWIYAQTLREFQLYELINYTGKMNMLKTAKGVFLDALGARMGITRNAAQKAVTTITITLSEAQVSVIPIIAGTQFTPGNNVFFETLEYAEIPAGQTSINVTAYASISGKSGNNYVPGQINTLVNPLPYIQSVTNIDTTQGGTDIESDESFAERLFIAPEGYSVAGPSGAYEYFTKQFSSAIEDVKVRQTVPGTVEVRVLLANAEIPSETFLNELKEYLSASDKRPLTDNLITVAPDVIDYNIDIKYWINTSNLALVTSIQQNITKAVDDYVVWQENSIGRDINPDELVKLVMNAGAKRVEITEPVFTVLSDIEVAKIVNKDLSFQGLE